MFTCSGPMQVIRSVDSKFLQFSSIIFEDSATQRCRNSERAESLAEAKFYTVWSQNDLRTKRCDSMFQVHTVVRTHQCNFSKGVGEMLMHIIGQRTNAT